MKSTYKVKEVDEYLEHCELDGCLFVEDDSSQVQEYLISEQM